MAHPGEIGRLLRILAWLKYAKMRFAVGAIIRFGRANGETGHKMLACHLVAARAVGKAVREYAVEILLQVRRER